MFYQNKYIEIILIIICSIIKHLYGSYENNKNKYINIKIILIITCSIIKHLYGSYAYPLPLI